MELTPTQLCAIKQMLSSFYGYFSMEKWNKKIFDYFVEYKFPPIESSLSLNTYYKELSELPIEIKRDIIHNVFLAWRRICEYDFRSLHTAFTKLAYLKICTGKEYFFMNAIESFIDYFGTEEMWAKSYNSCHYTLIYDNDYHYDYDSIDFNFNDEINQLTILVSGNLINKKTPFGAYPSQSHIETLIDLIKSQPLKVHMPWIYANCGFKCIYSGGTRVDKGVVAITLTNIEYIDSNHTDYISF